MIFCEAAYYFVDGGWSEDGVLEREEHGCVLGSISEPSGERTFQMNEKP